MSLGEPVGFASRTPRSAGCGWPRIWLRKDSPPGLIDYVAALITSLPVAVTRFWPRAVFVLVLIGDLGVRELPDPHADPFCLPRALYTPQP